MRLTATALIFVLSAGPAFADDPCSEFKKQYSAIGEALCAKANFDKADHSLNIVYKDVLSHLKEEGRDLKPLIAAERAWIVERDSRCAERAKEEDLIDRTGDAVITDCMTKWTKARIEMLNDYLE